MQKTLKVNFWKKFIGLTIILFFVFFGLLYFTLDKLNLTQELVAITLIGAPGMGFYLFFSFYKKEVTRILKQNIGLDTYYKYKLILKDYYNNTLSLLPLLFLLGIISFLIYYNTGKNSLLSKTTISIFFATLVSLFLLNYIYYKKLTKMY